MQIVNFSFHWTDLWYNEFRRNDPLAQLGERLGDNQKVDSSSLLRVTREKALKSFEIK